MNEILALRELQSDHIFGLLDLIQTKDYLYLVTECGGKDLFDYFEQLNGGLSETETRAIFLKTATALKHCHTSGFCHRDLKPENILLDTTTGRLHIIDFGLCARVSKNEQLSDFCGSPGFFAPEMITKGLYNGYQADLWSLGCILLELLLGHKQFEQLWMSAYDLHVLDDAQLFATQIKKTVHQMLAAFRDSSIKDLKPVSQQCLSALQSTLVLEPTKRATVDELLAMEWCTSDTHARAVMMSSSISKSKSFSDRPRSTSRPRTSRVRSNKSPPTATTAPTALKPLKSSSSKSLFLDGGGIKHNRPTPLLVGDHDDNISSAGAKALSPKGRRERQTPKGRRERKISIGGFDAPRFKLEVARSGSVSTMRRRLPPMRNNSPFTSPLTPNASTVKRLVHNSEDVLNRLNTF